MKNCALKISLIIVLSSALILLWGCRDSNEDAPKTVDLSCGGLQGLHCAVGQFCNFKKPECLPNNQNNSPGCLTNLLCGAADETGICEAVPQICTQEYAPVCGCDENTYSNACSANSAGVSVAYDGMCVADSPNMQQKF